MFKYKKILVPTDFSDNAFKALELVQEIADVTQAEVHILHVVEPNLIPTDVLVYPKTTLDEVEVLTKTKANEKMEKTINKIKKKGLRIHTGVKKGNPPDEIIAYAQENDIDLICISTYGVSGLEHLVFGSVSEKVLRKSECDTIAIKSADTDTEE